MDENVIGRLNAIIVACSPSSLPSLPPPLPRFFGCVREVQDWVVLVEGSSSMVSDAIICSS